VLLFSLTWQLTHLEAGLELLLCKGCGVKTGGLPVSRAVDPHPLHLMKHWVVGGINAVTAVHITWPGGWGKGSTAHTAPGVYTTWLGERGAQYSAQNSPQLNVACEHEPEHHALMHHRGLQEAHSSAAGHAAQVMLHRSCCLSQQSRRTYELEVTQEVSRPNHPFLPVPDVTGSPPVTLSHSQSLSIVSVSSLRSLSSPQCDAVTCGHSRSHPVTPVHLVQPSPCNRDLRSRPKLNQDQPSPVTRNPACLVRSSSAW